jgi:hypothetical protein
MTTGNRKLLRINSSVKRVHLAPLAKVVNINGSINKMLLQSLDFCRLAFWSGKGAFRGA